MKLVVRGVVLAASLPLVAAACSGNDEPSASSATIVSAPATRAPSSTANSQAAMEQAFVTEVMGQMPDLVVSPAGLIGVGRDTCEAFRREPGTVATLANDMRKAGQSEEEVKTAKVITIAAIHNLCTDQAGDL